ncbi:MAG: PilZ domain-containing protein [Pseudomonadota bacterium]
MTGVETRSVTRDSLFLLASVQVEDESDVHRVRVRNLSDGGMMAEGSVFVRRGHRLEIELRNIGKVGGSVAWVQDKRFGIAFDREIDSQRARKPAETDAENAPKLMERSWAHRAPTPPEPKTLRKI